MTTAMQRKAKKKKGFIETKEQKFNKLINECVSFLVEGNVKAYVEGVKELAHQMKSAGSDNQAFMDLCKHIEQQAIQKTENPFIETHIKLAIRDEFTKQSGLIRV